MPTYKIITNVFDTQYIELTDDNGVIRYVPIDKSNSDYQAYLASLDDTN